MGGPGGQQSGWAADPQPIAPGQSQPGWAANPSPMGASRNWPRSPDISSGSPSDALASLSDDLAGAAARFIGRKIGRKVQDRLEQAMSAATAKQQDMLQQQIAIAERHPDLRACLNDQVVFLAGGTSTVPMPNITTITVEQADAVVAQLRNG